LRVIQEVHQKDGQTVKKLSPLKKSIYSMEHYIRFAKEATRRYLDFLNRLALGAVADFGAQNCRYATKVDAR
jgi:hypothetical protein